MKTLKLLGIIALSTLIIIWSVSCGDPTEEDPYLEGVLSIEVGPGGPYIGQTLKAVYTGNENVTYEWFRDTTSMKIEATGRGMGVTYEPESAGSYSVKVTAVDFVADVVSCANPIVVTAAPAYIKYLGTWIMKGADNSNWKASTHTGVTTVDETIVITYNRFELTSNYKTEHLKFNTAIPWDTAQSSNTLLSGYTDGFKLAANGTVDAEDYSDTDVQYLFFKTESDGTVKMVRAYTKEGTTVPAPFENGSGAARFFVKQP